MTKNDRTGRKRSCPVVFPVRPLFVPPLSSPAFSVAPAEPRRKLNGDERGRHVTFRVAAAESHAISGAVTHSGHHSLSAHSTAVAAVGVSTDHHNPLLVVRCCPSQPRCVPGCALLIECVD